MKKKEKKSKNSTKGNTKANKKELAEKQQRKWVTLVTIGTFFSTVFITYVSDALLAQTPLLISFLILIFIIIFGVTSDTIGVAVTAVSPEPFNAMAARKVFGAKTAVKLIKNAPRFSSICNDVVGDICGIVSGATGVSITAQLLEYYPTFNAILLSLIMSGFIACFTVGGKAFGKEFAMKNSVAIIFFVAKIMSTVKRIFGVKE